MVSVAEENSRSSASRSSKSRTGLSAGVLRFKSVIPSLAFPLFSSRRISVLLGFSELLYLGRLKFSYCFGFLLFFARAIFAWLALGEDLFISPGKSSQISRFSVFLGAAGLFGVNLTFEGFFFSCLLV